MDEKRNGCRKKTRMDEKRNDCRKKTRMDEKRNDCRKKTRMDEKRNGCVVCFHDFDRRIRRPIVVPCGHTFCSKCVCDNFKENLLVCPICRKEHHADTVADFPVNFIFENILFGGISTPSTFDEISRPTIDQPKALSKKLKSITIELCSGVENKATHNKEVRSQLHQYENLLSEKEIIHHHIKEKHSAIAQRNDDIIQIIRKERARIADSLKEEEEEAKRMKILTEKLHAATTRMEVLMSIEDASICFDFLERWNQEAQEIFPNIQLLTKSGMLFEQSQILLQTLPNSRGEAAVEEPTDYLSENMASLSIHVMDASSESPNENDAHEESSLLNPKLSIQEKVTRAVQNASISKQTKAPVNYIDKKSVQAEKNTTVTQLISKGIQIQNPTPSIECLRMRMESVMKLVNQKRLFAVQKFEGRRRFAQISLQEKNRIVLHCLKDQKIPTNAHLLKHSDVMKLVNISYRLVFLELWSAEKKKMLGKLFIHLSPKGKRAKQFSLLCSGQSGPSYVDSNIVNLKYEGTKNECLQCGDYEKLGGNNRRDLVLRALNEKGGVFKRPCLAGTIRGYTSYASEERAAHFIINTRDKPGHKLDRCFGMVEEGLSILLDAIDNHEDIRQVIFSDAGLVLDI